MGCSAASEYRPSDSVSMQNIVRSFVDPMTLNIIVHEHVVVLSDSKLIVIHVCMLKG